MKIECEKGGIIAWHGTDRMDFTSFDVSRAAPYNVGLHFGTRAAALDRVAYLREHTRPRRTARLLKCRLDIRNPFRVDDVFGFSYVGIITALEDEIVSRESACRAAPCVVFDARQISVLGEETVPCRIGHRVSA